MSFGVGAGVGVDEGGFATGAAVEAGGNAATPIAASATAASAARERRIGDVVSPRDMHGRVPVVGRAANAKPSGGRRFDEVRRPAPKRLRVNHDDTRGQADPLESPALAEHLSEGLRALLRRADDGDDAARREALPAVAAITDAFAAVGLLEFAYLAPTDDENEDGPIAWLEASEAIHDLEREAVVIAGSEVLEVYEGPITLEDPPEHEDDAE